MGTKNKLTPRGYAVKGALAAHIAPRLAADSALKPGELDALIKGIEPGAYKDQIPAFVKAVGDAFSKRLAQDTDLDLGDLEEILEAVGEGGEGEEDMDDDDMGDSADGAGAELMKMLGKYEIPTEDLDKINGLVTQLSKGGAADKAGKDAKAKDAGKPPFPAKKPDAAKPEPVDVQQAMDAALPGIEKRIAASIEARHVAAAEVEPHIGKVSALASDSAETIYKLALDAKKIDLTGVHPSAYRHMVKMLPKPGEQGPGAQPARGLVGDAKAIESFNKRYPNVPLTV